MKKLPYSYSFKFTVYLFIVILGLSKTFAEPVNIPDPGLRRALEEAFGKSSGDIITEEEMGADSFKIFSASGRNISNLSGLEYATSLQYVYLESNSISDISSLSDLTGLEHLHLEHNQISDLSALSNITNLQSLNISYNNLTGLGGLPDLSATYALFFQHNQITSIQSLVDHTEYTGIGKTHTKVVDLNGNPLDEDSVNVHIPNLLFDRFIDVQFTSIFLKKVSGNNQTTTTNTQLDPFVVEVSNHKDQKVPDIEVRFILTSGSGNFADGSNDGKYEILNTKTDGDGRASGTLTTGLTTGKYRIAVEVREFRSNSLFVTGVKPFTVTVKGINISTILDKIPQSQPEYTVQQQQETPSQEQQQEQEEQPSQEQQQEQEEQPSQEQEEQEEQQQEQEETQETSSNQNTQELPPQQQETQSSQQQQETPPQQKPETEEEKQQPTKEQEQVTQTQEPEQQQQQEQELQTDPQPESISQQPEPRVEPDYTKIPFDYRKEGVGKVVFSELMLAHLGKYPQWIELYNTTDKDIDINGWKIVGRFLDDLETVHIIEAQVISKSFTIESKETCLIVNYSIPNSRDRISKGLADKTYDLKTASENLLNYKGIVLELQDAEDNPIDRVGNLNVSDEIIWEIPILVRNRRVSLIRRLKSIRSQVYNFTLGVKEFGWFPASNVDGLFDKRNQYYYGRYTDIGSPGFRTEDGETLPVTLSSFSPKLQKNGDIIINWVTESEIENAGFNILRSQTKQGPFVKVNAKLIQGAGTTGERSFYKWIDTTAKSNVVYYYQIEDVSFAGKRQTLTTARLKGLLSAKNRFTTLLGQMKGRD